MIKINEMNPGKETVGFEAIIISVTVGKTNGANKSSYLNIVLQDATGTIDAKLWSATDEQIRLFERGQVVRGKGDIINYKGMRQMKIVKLEPIEMNDEQKALFLPQPPIEKAVMQKELDMYMKKIHNIRLYAIVHGLIEKHYTAFVNYPAATKNHHDFASGLFYHTLCMLKLADQLINVYSYLDADLLYAGVILHDIGKVKEFTGPIVPAYSIEGSLVGHISIGHAMVKDMAEELHIEGEEVFLLEHMILSHHGKQEYGSPVLPQIPEAEALTLIDNVDARMNMFEKALNDTEPGSYSARIFGLENRNVYKSHH